MLFIFRVISECVKRVLFEFEQFSYGNGQAENTLNA